MKNIKREIDPIGELSMVYGVKIIKSPHIKEPTLVIPEDFNIEKDLKERRESLGIFTN